MLELVGYLWNSSEFHMYHPVSSEHGVSVTGSFKMFQVEPDGTWVAPAGRQAVEGGGSLMTRESSRIQLSAMPCDQKAIPNLSASILQLALWFLDHIFLHFVKFNEFRMPSECLQNAFAEFVVSRSELCTTRHPENRGARKPPGRCPDNQQQWGNLGCGWNMIKHDKIW